MVRVGRCWSECWSGYFECWSARTNKIPRFLVFVGRVGRRPTVKEYLVNFVLSLKITNFAYVESRFVGLLVCWSQKIRKARQKIFFMITTSITLTPYLAEYLRGKYASGSDNVVNIPDSSDLYHVIWNYMSRRPSDVAETSGNITIALPCRREGKDPAIYNYLSERAVRCVDKAVRREFNQELHSFLLENDQRGHLFDNIDVVLQFINMYCLESITEDALLKNFYRWRENLRKRKARRERKKGLIGIL